METIADDITVMRRTPLEPGHVDALRKLGSARRYAKGEMVARPGEPMDRFIYVEDGEIEVVDPYSGKRMFKTRSARPSSSARSRFWAGARSTSRSAPPRTRAPSKCRARRC